MCFSSTLLFCNCFKITAKIGKYVAEKRNNFANASYDFRPKRSNVTVGFR